MRIATRRLLLPLVAVLAAVAVFGVVVALTREDRLAEAGSGAAAVGAAPGRAGTPGTARQPTAVRGDPATAGLPRVVGTVTTTDLVMIWNRDEVGSVPARSGSGTGAQLRLDLTVTPAANRALAVVRVRNLTARRVALIGTLQLLVSGPGAPPVSRQRLNRPLAVGATSTVTLAFRPGGTGAYRVRAVFTP
jgi:hypothetical protein